MRRVAYWGYLPRIHSNLVLGLLADRIKPKSLMMSMAQRLHSHWNRLERRFYGITLLSGLFILALAALSQAQTAPLLVVIREGGSTLYARQDTSSDQVAKLAKDEKLIPLAEALGPEKWYMVRTQQGNIGWVPASDVSPSAGPTDLFKTEHVSTWSVMTSTGRVFEGTWNLGGDTSGDKAAGTWTLSDATGNVVLRGMWSAEKFSTGWDGVWFVSTENGQGDYRGSWAAAFPHGPEVRIRELFQAAARDAVRGIWNSGDLSGSWLIRAAQ